MNETNKSYKINGKHLNKIIQIVWLKLVTKHAAIQKMRTKPNNNTFNIVNSTEDIFKTLEHECLISETNCNNVTEEMNNCSITPSFDVSPISFGSSAHDLFEQYYLDNALSPLSKISNTNDIEIDQHKQINYDSLKSMECSPISPSTNYSYNYSSYSYSPYPSYSYSPYPPYSYSPYPPYSNSTITPQPMPQQFVYPNNNNNNINNNNNDNHDSRSEFISKSSKSTNCSPRCPPKPDFDKLSVQTILMMNLSIKELIDNGLMSRLIIDQFGSRFLQKTFKSSSNNTNNTNNINDFDLFLNHLICNHDLSKISQHRFGNYSIQILFERGTFEHHEMLLNEFMHSNILELSKSEYGCRVIQKALHCIKKEEMLVELIRNLEQECVSYNDLEQEEYIDFNKLHDCFVDVNANHVFQKIINLKLSFENIRFIKYGLEQKLSFYSGHSFSCRIVQCFVKQYGDKLDTNILFKNHDYLALSTSMYGNYVIQCLIDDNKWYSYLHGIDKFRWKLIKYLFVDKNIMLLSKDKFGSNVIEKCIKVSTEKQISTLITTLCSRNSFVLKEMIKDSYGNYVINTLLKNANIKQKIFLIKEIEQIHKLINIKNNNKYTEILFNEIQIIKNMINNQSKNKYHQKRIKERSHEPYHHRSSSSSSHYYDYNRSNDTYHSSTYHYY